MAEITLLRHGQASFGSDNYDQLSALGQQQALWLGQYLNALGENFDRIVSGTMVRHQQTTAAVLTGFGASADTESHAGLNEYDFQGLLSPLKEKYADQWQSTGQPRKDYYHNMHLALTYWMDGRIESDGQDSWPSFCQRVSAGLDFALAGSAKRTLIISSGGPIAVVLAKVMQLDAECTCNLTLQIKNTSASKLLFRRPANNARDFTLDSFNDVSHLRSPERKSSITFS